MSDFYIEKSLVQVNIIGEQEPIFTSSLTKSSTQNNYVKITNQEEVLEFIKEKCNRYEFTGIGIGKKIVFRQTDGMIINSTNQYVMTMLMAVNDEFVGGDVIVNDNCHTLNNYNLVFPSEYPFIVEPIMSGNRVMYMFEIYGSKKEYEQVYHMITDCIVENWEYKVEDYDEKAVEMNKRVNDVISSHTNNIIIAPYYRYNDITFNCDNIDENGVLIDDTRVHTVIKIDDIEDSDVHSIICGIDASIVHIARAYGYNVFLVDTTGVIKYETPAYVATKNGISGYHTRQRSVWGNTEYDYGYDDNGDTTEYEIRHQILFCLIKKT